MKLIFFLMFFLRTYIFIYYLKIVKVAILRFFVIYRWFVNNYSLQTISSNLLLIIFSSLLPLIGNLINGILYLDSILFFNISLSFCLLSSLWYLYPSGSTANNGILLILLYIKKSIWVLWWEVYLLYSSASNVLFF